MKSVFLPGCLGCKSHSTHKQIGFAYKILTKNKQVYFRPSDSSHVLFVLSGELTVYTEEMGGYLCRTNEMILLLNSIHYQLTPSNKTDIIILRFNSSIQACDYTNVNLPNLTQYEGEYRFHSLEVREPLRAFLDSIVYYFNSGIQCAHLHKGKGMELFIILRHYYSREEMFRFFRPSLQKNMGFHSLVMENYLHAATVTELASKCGYQLSNFKKLFLKHFQTSPHQWMREQMSNSIQVMLRETDVPIKTIAQQFHFTDQSHFNAYCKKHFGATAAQIRKSMATK